MDNRVCYTKLEVLLIKWVSPKNNRGFRRFLLRGLPKVSLEVGWLPLAHNLLKKAASNQNRKMVCKSSTAPPFFSFDHGFCYECAVSSVSLTTNETASNIDSRLSYPITLLSQPLRSSFCSHESPFRHNWYIGKALDERFAALVP